jgi:hypothetical protein
MISLYLLLIVFVLWVVFMVLFGSDRGGNVVGILGEPPNWIFKLWAIIVFSLLGISIICLVV